MSKRSDYQPLNDGLLEYGDLTTKRDKETAKKIGEELTTRGRLYFGYKSIVAKYDSYRFRAVLFRMVSKLVIGQMKKY